MIKKGFLLALILIGWILSSGIFGPLLIDDNLHLGPILQWALDGRDTSSIILDNPSGPFGRPVSILSFMVNVLLTGPSIWPMKLTNLALHLLTGYCLAKLFYRLFLRDSCLRAHAEVASMFFATLWVLIPQHIATVFYLVQRMTILSTLFAILACWLYVLAREQMEQHRHGSLRLFAGVIGFTLLSTLSKESGLLVPIYCLLIECIYFRASVEKPRPAVIAWGFRLGVFLPCMLVATYLAFTPSFVLHGYNDRSFTLPERVMTQISVLADYFASTFLPLARSAGVYNDDFPIASTWATKESLLLSVGILLVTAAIRLRISLPSFSFGIGLFFTGHLLESSIFPLEIYFVHRNYFPSIGLVIACSGLVTKSARAYRHNSVFQRRILPFAFCGIFLFYGIVTYSRTKLWSENDALLTHAQIHHPTSSRLRSELIMGAMYANRLDIALQQSDLAMQTVTDNEKRTIQLWRILAYCYTRSPQPSSELEALRNMPADRITMNTSTALDYVSAAAEVNACPGLDREKLGHLTKQWSINTTQYSWETYVWKTHLASARLLASSGDLKSGYNQALWAFNDSGYNFDAGLLAYQLANSLGDTKASRKILTRLRDNQDRYTNLQQSQLQTLRTQ